MTALRCAILIAGGLFVATPALAQGDQPAAAPRIAPAQPATPEAVAPEFELPPIVIDLPRERDWSHAIVRQDPRDDAIIIYTI